MSAALRISASDLDAWRRYRDSEDVPLEQLLAQLRRELPPSPAMLAGTALHHALEHAPAGVFETLEAKGHRFTFAADCEIALPEIRELKVTREALIGDVPVTLVGMVDGLHGKTVTDHKFTSRFDPERYLNSYQWRVYLDLFDADRFDWIVYEAVPDRADDRHYTIKGVHDLTARRYPGMTADLEAALAEFVDFARVHLLREDAA